MGDALRSTSRHLLARNGTNGSKKLYPKLFLRQISTITMQQQPRVRLEPMLDLSQKLNKLSPKPSLWNHRHCQIFSWAMKPIVTRAAKMQLCKKVMTKKFITSDK